MSNLYDGGKWMSGSWKPLKTDPGTGADQLHTCCCETHLLPGCSVCMSSCRACPSSGPYLSSSPG